MNRQISNEDGYVEFRNDSHAHNKKNGWEFADTHDDTLVQVRMVEY